MRRYGGGMLYAALGLLLNETNCYYFSPFKICTLFKNFGLLELELRKLQKMYLYYKSLISIPCKNMSTNK